jgi:hypothetical protein
MRLSAMVAISTCWLRDLAQAGDGAPYPARRRRHRDVNAGFGALASGYLFCGKSYA